VVSMGPGHGFGAGFPGSTSSNSWTPKAGNPGAREGAQSRRTSENEIIFDPEEQ
jgi:hypothetical protein